ncbi:urotensin-2 [Phodopus roborovskii]|uniref:Urotensin-2 n=1 Tax=Phodopus roborovskii TaxID=109678 RepID=A0AAV0ABQ5_PHORO|nr:urotensin-2 [Phodopus roborovskii]CAH7446813.1 Uts2 [Phodopus roborovskii]
MDRLAFCCLLFTGLLYPLLSLPVTDTGEKTLQLPVLEEDARLALEELERTALLQTLLKQTLGTEAGEGLREADPSAGTPTLQGSLRKDFPSQALSGQHSSTMLSRLLARTRKQRKQHGTVSECFWKYCI